MKLRYLLFFLGTVFGMLLRHISIAAQNQNAIAVGVASEAFQNIRTVKAFSMEEAEKK